MRDLSSDILGTGDTISKYQQAQAQSTIVDFDLKGLPEATQPEDLKKIAAVKHVINVVVDTDSIRNICLGTGRIKLRLAENEDVDNVKLQFLKAGYGIQDHEENPKKKKSTFTSEQALQVQSPHKDIDSSKQAKLSNLATGNPEIFGNTTGQQQTKFQNQYDPKEINQNN